MVRRTPKAPEDLLESPSRVQALVLTNYMLSIPFTTRLEFLRILHDSRPRKINVRHVNALTLGDLTRREGFQNDCGMPLGDRARPVGHEA